MKRLLVLPALFLMFGCAQNYFNVPGENFADKVRMLGVAPIMIDADSDIRYPQKDLLLPLVAEMNRVYEPQFVRKIKGTGSFYTVALLDGDPQQTFANLFFRREKRDDATIRYNKYFWKTDGLREYIRRNNLDAVMFIVVSGLEMTDKISSDTFLKSMTSDYNYLVMTAQILDADGTILWEYPNFRGRILTYDPMINLQYPDFSEADANLSTTPNVKFKTIEGVKKTFSQKRKDLLRRETTESEVYSGQFDEMLSYLKSDTDKDKKDAQPKMGKPVVPAEQPKAVEQPVNASDAVAAPLLSDPVPTAVPEPVPVPAPVASPPVEAPEQSVNGTVPQQ